MRRYAAVILGIVTLVGCQSPVSRSSSANPIVRAQDAPAIEAEKTPAIPREQISVPGQASCDPYGMTGGPSMPAVPMPRGLAMPWKPPGIAGPWPYDEWLHDGGDRDVHVSVTPEPAVRGLDLEDTVVHYDDAGGRTHIEPSNRVHLYSPRFLAVRKVSMVELSQQRERVAGAEQPVGLIQHDERQLAGTTLQPIQPIGEIGIKQPSIERLNQPVGRVIERLHIARFDGGVMPHENLSIIKFGIFEREEEARLAELSLAAITWSHDKAVQVIIDTIMAHEEVGDQKAQVTFTVDLPQNPRLRVIKTASTQVARSGDEVDFTIRYDNTGDQELNNVTLLDNLTTRLEYVDDSAQSSRAAEFNTQRNEGDSLVLRWDFAEPLKPGEGGLVRFKCRVR